MNKTWIVSDRDSLATLKAFCCGNLEYQFLTYNEIERLHPFAVDTLPDTIVLDTKSVPQWNSFVITQATVNPSVSIILLVPSSCQTVPASCFVDKVIQLPTDAYQLGTIVEHLLARVSAASSLKEIRLRLRAGMGESQIIGKSIQISRLLKRLPAIAAPESTVLITGETGVGKELIARALHYLGPRHSKPFIPVDCGALSETLSENELFGHLRGAYTDAGSASKGMVREAEGGTLFLDEVEALSPTTQVKLLRFLQEKQVKPLGQSHYHDVDVRVVAATNIDLQQLVHKGLFRADLYYRLNVIPIHIPALRERKSDIPILARQFLLDYSTGSDGTRTILLPLLEQWMKHDWPGNVRELQNAVQAWLADAHEPATLASRIDQSEVPLPSLGDIKREAIAACERRYLGILFTRVSGNISAAARMAGTDRKRLRLLLSKHRLTANQFKTQLGLSAPPGAPGPHPNTNELN